MKTIYHPSNERGIANHGWLNTAHSFSFANYYDPNKMGFETLRVINDDCIAGGYGFGMHPHNNMEIITIPLTGALEHKDSMGNSGIIEHGEVQVMSAGSGVVHSEYNASKTEPVTLLQIWVETNTHNVKPHYDQKLFEFEKNKWTQIVSPNSKNGSLMIHQDAFFSIGHFDANQTIKYDFKISSNAVYLFMINGRAETCGQKINKRDGLGILSTSEIELNIFEDSEVLLMEIPKKGHG